MQLDKHSTKRKDVIRCNYIIKMIKVGASQNPNLSK